MSVGHYFSEHRLGLERDVPESDRRMAQEVADDYDRRQRLEADDRHQQLSEVVESGNRRIREVLGEDRWLGLRRRMRDERIRFRDMFQPPAARYADYDTLNAERRPAAAPHPHRARGGPPGPRCVERVPP